MKVTVDCLCAEKEFEITKTQKAVICNEIKSEILDADLKRRLQYVLMHKYEQCFKRLKEEWEQKLANNGVKSFPADKDEFAKLVFSQADYKDRSTRDEEAKQI